MRGFSKAIITGNLTRDPELRTTSNGANVCSFSVAVNRVYKDASGEQKEAVSYIDCSAWSRLGEMIAQYAKKGTGRQRDSPKTLSCRDRCRRLQFYWQQLTRRQL